MTRCRIALAASHYVFTSIFEHVVAVQAHFFAAILAAQDWLYLAIVQAKLTGLAIASAAGQNQDAVAFALALFVARLAYFCTAMIAARYALSYSFLQATITHCPIASSACQNLFSALFELFIAGHT